MDESVVTYFEQQQVGKLRLSEAIRIGAAKRPGCLGAYAWGGSSCALMAAAEAVGMPYREGVYSWEVEGYLARHLGVPLSLAIAVVARADSLHETREQISDWLAAQGL